MPNILNDRQGAIAFQILRVIALTVVGVLAFEAIFAFVWRYGFDMIELPFSNRFVLLLFFLAVSLRRAHPS